MSLHGREFVVAQNDDGAFSLPPEFGALRGVDVALKPAAEHWILARKPLDGTVAANVLQYGTGGLNIDGCRVGLVGEKPPRPGGVATSKVVHIGAKPQADLEDTRAEFKPGDNSTGRWPPNVLLNHSASCRAVGTCTMKGDPRGPEVTDGVRPSGFANVGAERGDGRPNAAVYGNETVPVYECSDDCPVRALDAQSGANCGQQAPLKGGETVGFRASATVYGEGNMKAKPLKPHDAPAGASRFFPTFVLDPETDDPSIWPPFLYVAKAARSEREAGRPVDFDGKVWCTHPTVKPVALMRWLCRLITPPDGLILDPFLGSGSTGIAALLEGFRFVGVDREPNYMRIAEARIAHAAAQPSAFRHTAPTTPRTAAPATSARVVVVDSHPPVIPSARPTSHSPKEPPMAQYPVIAGVDESPINDDADSNITHFFGDDGERT